MELIVLAILGGQFLIVQFGGAVFRTEPLDWQTWLIIIGSSSLVLWIGELIRLVKTFNSEMKMKAIYHSGRKESVFYEQDIKLRFLCVLCRV